MSDSRKPKNNSGKGKKDHKKLGIVMDKKPVKKIVEYYYFLDPGMDAGKLLAAVGEEFDERSDIWRELNLIEIVMDIDSLIFQDASECFIDPEDLKYFDDNNIGSKYQISFDVNDIESVCKVMKNIMAECGGRICSDTDDFEPSYDIEGLESFKNSI